MSRPTLYLIPDVDRIAAARWAARELVLGRFCNGPIEWTHRVDAKGAIVSEVRRTRRRR